MQKKYYIIIIGLISILSIIYFNQTDIINFKKNNTFENNVNKSFVTDELKIINQTNITKENKF